MFPLSLLETIGPEEILQRPPVLADCPGSRLTNNLDVYEYLTEQYVTRDYTRIDLLKLANIVAQYDLRVVETVAKRCKALHHFTIPYLAASLDQEASEVIEEIRRETEIDVKVAQTKTLKLPDHRPQNISERLSELIEERRIDRSLRGE